METAGLKKFAQAARRVLLEQVRNQLELVLQPGSLAERESEKAVAQLKEQIALTSKGQVIEQAAYTWFNRFCALRFMDANRYTRIGTVSPQEGFNQPEILAEAKQGHIDEDLKIDREHVMELLDGTLPSDDPQQEAYRLLLIAVCNHYHKLMPFMFEEIADYTELLMPDDLLSEHSILTQMRETLTPEACKDVEVIGWLYQFYISEKKDDVFAALKKGKKITPENIPAATQLFTPHWIVRYLVENSLGRLWMLNFPDSQLIEQMEYYIAPEPEEAASDEGQGASEDENSRHSPLAPDHLVISSPEELQICDPACGSGHMLTYAFDLLYAIYEEQGYAASDIPRLILTHNLYGIEIDQRAGALAAFALTMKAREKDRRFFSRKRRDEGRGASDEKGNSSLATRHSPLTPNICVLENIHFESDELEQAADEVESGEWSVASLRADLLAFEEADNFGSLIRPQQSTDQIKHLLNHFSHHSPLATSHSKTLFEESYRQKVLKALRQADYLSSKYHVVVANPPYLGSKGMNPRLGDWLKSNYSETKSAKSDLFAIFIERCVEFTVARGQVAMITMQSWMFLSSYEKLRNKLLATTSIVTMAHLGARAFDSIGGDVVSTTSFVLSHSSIEDAKGVYFRLVDGGSENEKSSMLGEAIRDPRHDLRYAAAKAGFQRIPSSPVAYWVTPRTLELFDECPPLGDLADARVGLLTSDNDRFLRYVWEVSESRVCDDATSSEEADASGKRWFPHNKGGASRKWAGNQEFLVNWESNGREIKELVVEKYPYLNGDPNFVVHDDGYYFRPAVSWSEIGSGGNAFRFFPSGYTFNIKGMCAFDGEQCSLQQILSYCNTNFASMLTRVLNPTLSFGVGDFNSLPGALLPHSVVCEITDELVSLSQSDWDSMETSTGFAKHQLLRGGKEALEVKYDRIRESHRDNVARVKELEEQNNRLFNDEFRLSNELSHDVPVSEITLLQNPVHRYGDDKSESELEALLLADTMREFISYAVGCMLGRYSLDAPGLILANAGDTLEDYYRIVSAKRVSSDEGRVTSKGASDGSEELSGSDRLAEGDGSGGDGLSGDQAISEGRNVRTDESGSAGSGVGSVEHRRGASEELDSGVSQLPLDSEGVSGGSGNSTSDRQPPELYDEGTTRTDSQSPDGSQQNAQRPDENSRHSPLTTPPSFLPDEDNVIPLLSGEWFEDDIVQRFKEFLKVTFGTENYEENLQFLEDALYPDNATARKRKTIRDYFLKEFYNHHIKLYKKRPIYWLFSSPKGTFNALIYMHRYRPDTVSIVLNDYLREFMTKLRNEIEHMQSIADSASAAKTEKTKALKQITQYKKDLKELEEYEREILYPLASDRIEIDLDDGVKVNYNKFGTALKKVSGLTQK